jgi:anti-sigma factor RsiW
MWHSNGVVTKFGMHGMGSEAMQCDRVSIVAAQDLHAFLDGRLDSAASCRVAARVRHDPAAADRLRAYRSLNLGLAALYGPIAAEPVPFRLARLVADAVAGNAVNAA